MNQPRFNGMSCQGFECCSVEYGESTTMKTDGFYASKKVVILRWILLINHQHVQVPKMEVQNTYVSSMDTAYGYGNLGLLTEECGG